MGDLDKTQIQVTVYASKILDKVATKATKQFKRNVTKGDAVRMAAENYEKVLDELAKK